MNNPQLLIDAIVQQTMVSIAQLATSGGLRAPLAGVANKVFIDLSEELTRQGVKKKVIADMFGMALHLEAQIDLVGLAIYRNGPLSASGVLETTRLSEELCDAAHTELVTQGRVRRTQQDDEASYESHSFDMPLGSTQGWEAIVPVVADLGQYVQCESASPTETS